MFGLNVEYGSVPNGIASFVGLLFFGEEGKYVVRHVTGGSPECSRQELLAHGVSMYMNSVLGAAPELAPIATAQSGFVRSPRRADSMN